MDVSSESNWAEEQSFVSIFPHLQAGGNCMTRCYAREAFKGQVFGSSSEISLKLVMWQLILMRFFNASNVDRCWSCLLVCILRIVFLGAERSARPNVLRLKLGLPRYFCVKKSSTITEKAAVTDNAGPHPKLLQQKITRVLYQNTLISSDLYLTLYYHESPRTVVETLLGYAGFLGTNLSPGPRSVV